LKLSIITVNLNNSQGLKKTLESVDCQTFQDFEYILIDGGSTDGSVELIKQHKSSFIYQISEPDSGVYNAMNKGIRKAIGEYLLFLNSGDFLVNKDVLSNVFSGNHNSDFLLGRCNISERGVVVQTTNPPAKITFGYLYEFGLAHQSTFIKREMFEKFGLYREDFRYNADIEFWYRTIILQCSSTVTLSTIICDYNKEGISSKESQTDLYLGELAEIYSNPLLQLFIPDYDAWIAERKEMEILRWVKSKRLLYGILLSIYQFAVWIVRIRK
jgi:glycosyltransferase involved in cell wall biosynthesis